MSLITNWRAARRVARRSVFNYEKGPRRIKKVFLSDEQMTNPKRAIFKVLARYPTKKMRQSEAVRRFAGRTMAQGFIHAPYIPLYTTPDVQTNSQMAAHFAQRFAESRLAREYVTEGPS